MTSVKIAVVSDLHAFDVHTDEHKNYSGFLNISCPEDEYTKNPISGLMKLIESNDDVRADLLLCAGDLSDKAYPAPLKYAWSKLNEIQTKLGASICVATAGNHDLDSRYIYNDFDSKGMLQSLNPRFPVNEIGPFDKFWSRNYVILENNRWRLLVLNSSAFHGKGPKENEHGRMRSVRNSGHHVMVRQPLAA